jgi:hypothetical protein
MLNNTPVLEALLPKYQKFWRKLMCEWKMWRNIFYVRLEAEKRDYKIVGVFHQTERKIWVSFRSLLDTNLAFLTKCFVVLIVWRFLRRKRLKTESFNEWFQFSIAGWFTSTNRFSRKRSRGTSLRLRYWSFHGRNFLNFSINRTEVFSRATWTRRGLWEKFRAKAVGCWQQEVFDLGNWLMASKFAKQLFMVCIKPRLNPNEIVYEQPVFNSLFLACERFKKESQIYSWNAFRCIDFLLKSPSIM